MNCTGHFTFAGTPEQTADLIQNWFDNGAADGFNIMPPVLPSMLDTFIEQVVPILQQRGLYRSDYTGPMLRDHLGIAGEPQPPQQGRGDIAAAQGDGGGDCGAQHCVRSNF